MFFDGFRQAGITFTQKAKIHGHILSCLEHFLDIPRSWCAGCGIGAGGRAGAATNHHCNAGHQGFIYLLRANKMDVCIDASGGKNLSFAGNHLGSRTNKDGNTILNIGIACFADGLNPAFFDGNICFDNAPVVQNQCVSNHQIRCIGTTELTLPHSIPNDFTTTKLNLVTIAGIVFLDFYK